MEMPLGLTETEPHYLDILSVDMSDSFNLLNEIRASWYLTKLDKYLFNREKIYLENASTTIIKLLLTWSQNDFIST